MTYGLLWSTGESMWGWWWWWWRWWCAWILVDNMPGFYWCKRAALHRLIRNPPRFNINHNFSSQSPRSIANSIKMMLQTGTQPFTAKYQLENYKSFDQICERNFLRVPFLELYILTIVFALEELARDDVHFKEINPLVMTCPPPFERWCHIFKIRVLRRGRDLKLDWVRLWTSN